MNEIAQRLKLVISNVEEIAGGTLNSHVFDEAGGSIGSSSTDTWVIKEGNKPSVSEHHMQIEFVDRRFCIREMQGDIYLNESIETLGKRKVTALSDGDSFSMGKYKIRALFISGKNEGANNLIGQMSLEEIVENGETDNSTQVVNQLIDSVEANPAVKLQKTDQSNKDILEFYEMSEHERNKSDPLLALQEEQKKADMNHMAGYSDKNKQKGLSALDTQQDVSVTTQASFSDQGIPTNQFSHIESELQRMENDFSSGKNPETNFSHSTLNVADNIEKSSNHHLTANGAGSDMSSDMSNDMKKSLHVAIEGLKMLYAKDDKKGIKPALSSIPLQPIEDNPIRLDHSLQETIDMFYSGKVSPVFLSAPAAIKESLENIKHDQLATEKAIDESLQELLQALSPQILLQRFQRYASRNNTENPDAWAWKMYCYYYEELMMGRQNGFNRLFQELFSQSYDREMRRLQKQSDTEVIA